MIKIKIFIDDVGTYVNYDVVTKPTHIPLEVEIIELTNKDDI